MSRVHARLAPYVRHVLDEAASDRPCLRNARLFLHYDLPEYHAVQDQYLYGADLLVAPVIEAGVDWPRCIILPDGMGRICGPESR